MAGKKFEEGHPKILELSEALTYTPFPLDLCLYDYPSTFPLFPTGPAARLMEISLKSKYLRGGIPLTWRLSSQKKVLEQPLSNGRGWVCFDIDFLFLLPLSGEISWRDLIDLWFFLSAFIWCMTWWLKFYHYCFFFLFEYYGPHNSISKDENGETALFKTSRMMQ